MTTECDTPMNYNSLYGCFRDEIEDIIRDFDDCEDELFIASIKTDAGLTIYSFPGHLPKIRSIMNELVSAMNNGEIYKLGSTWLNTKYVITTRICKWKPRKEVVNYEN